MLSLIHGFESWFIDIADHKTLWRRAAVTTLVGALLATVAGLMAAAGLLPELVSMAAFYLVMFGLPLWVGVTMQSIKRSRREPRR